MRKINDQGIRKLTKVGRLSIAVTIPLGIIRELGWQEKQKVMVKKKGSQIIISDWKK
jgi:antitoxin component of MazEF toxin-antitoxin module